MKGKSKHPAVAVAETLDRIKILESVDFVESVVYATPKNVIARLCPDYPSLEKTLEDKIGSAKFERENQDLHDLIYQFVDARTVLIWRLAGPVFLRLAGHSDKEIARVCSTLAIGGGGETRRQIIEG